MGRTLEGLTRMTGRRAEAEPPAVAPAPPPGPPEEDSLPGDDNSVPFVEVGGPKPSQEPPKPAPASVLVPQAPESADAAAERPARPAHESLIYFPVSFQPVAFPPRLPTARSPLVAAEVIVFHYPNHAISGQYRSLWSELTGTGQPPVPRIRVFISTTPGAGATTVVLNLAMTAARDPEARVLIVDGNVRSPALAGRLGLAGSPGVWEWVTRPFPLGLALQPTALTNVHLLPAGSVPKGPGPHGERLVLLADQLRRRFTCVLIDAGDWCHPAAAAWVRRAEAAYLVVRHSDADCPDVARVHEEAVQAGGPLKGYILTG